MKDTNSDNAIIKLYARKGVNVNAEDGEFGNALLAASFEGHKEVVQLLLEKGAIINAVGEYGNALSAASYQGRGEIVHLLLDKGANFNATVKGLSIANGCSCSQ